MYGPVCIIGSSLVVGILPRRILLRYSSSYPIDNSTTWCYYKYIEVKSGTTKETDMATKEITQNGLAWTRMMETFPADADDLMSRQKAAIERVLAEVMADSVRVTGGHMSDSATYNFKNRKITIAVPVK